MKNSLVNVTLKRGNPALETNALIQLLSKGHIQNTDNVN
jgi:hypothetical protein